VGGWPQLSSTGERSWEQKGPKNQSMQTRFSLTNGGRGHFCIVGMLLMWEKARWSGWVAMIKRRGQERALGSKIPKTEPCGLDFH
jgi:hypothetical protein